MLEPASQLPSIPPSRPPPPLALPAGLETTAPARERLSSGVRLRVPARPGRRHQGSALLGLLALSGCLIVVAVEQDAPASRREASPAPAAEAVPEKPQRWFRPEVSVVIDTSVDEIGPGAKLAVQHAFGEWLATGSRLPALSFSDGRDIAPSLDPDGVNSVIFAPIEFEGHQDDLAITIGFSDDETGEITEADIIINARQSFAALEVPFTPVRARSCNGEIESARCEHRYDLQNVLTHEVGHFYGLGEDETDRTSTMFSCTSPCETHKRHLGPGDVQLISSIYAPGSEQNWASMGCSIGPGNVNSGAAFAACGLLGLAAFGWRRRHSSDRARKVPTPR